MEDTATRLDGLTDVGRLGVASQSSLSRWSSPQGAQAAVQPCSERGFAIHTSGEEDRPWWQLDLGAWYPVERIIVRNRRRKEFWGRAKTIRIEASEDGYAWTLLHAGLSFFGADDGNALTLPLAGRVPLRFIRLSLDEREPLHLSRVEVLVAERDLRERRLMESIGLDFSYLTRYSHGGIKDETYRVIDAPDDPDGVVRGLRVIRTGRFANNVYQMAQALQIAELCGLDFVQMLDTDLFDFSSDEAGAHPRIIDAKTEAPPTGAVVAGDFYYMDRLGSILRRRTRTSRELVRLARARLARHLDLPPAPTPPGPHELLIHVRSGDLFGDDPHPKYGQPPLSFYTWSIHHALEHGFTSIRIVAEDRLSPVVPALEEHLLDHGIPHIMQLGEALGSDLATLLMARGLVFGVGTFGHAICMLSSSVEVIYESSGNNGYRKMFPDSDVFSVSPGDDYTPFSHWTKSSEQLAEMLAYPRESLTLREKPRSRPA